MKELSGYFDYAAATPALPSVFKAMQPYYIDKFYNSSALYLSAQENKQALDGARHQIAQLIGAKQSEIIFTAGGTEANNLAIKGLVGKYPDGQVVTSAIEHESVLEPAKLYNRTICRVDSKGFIDKDSLKKSITDKTVLVSVMYANNEIGTIEPLKEIRQVLDEVIEARKQAKNTLPLYLHSDACQAVNYLDMQVNRLGVDLMTINAGKIYGPKQCGALYIKSGVELLPLISGGGQEFNIRSGTENLPAIMGFSAAATEIRQNYHQEALRLSEIRDKFIDYVTSHCKLISVNGPVGKKRLANNINLTVEGKENETLLMQLDELGFKIATSSACSASNQEPSHVLRAIGLSDKNAQSSLRITLGRYSNFKNTMQLAESLLKIVDKN